MFAASSRLVLRPFRLADRAAFLAYRRDPEVARFQSWPAMTDDETDGFLDAMSRIKTPFHPGHWTQIALAEPRTDRLLGDMGLFLPGGEDQAELGVTLAAAEQGRGLGTEALRLAIGLAFARPGLSQVICGADARHAVSLAMIEKLGFAYTHDEPSAEAGQIDRMYAMPRDKWAR